MHITAVCCTYNRPELLAGSIAMFEQQTHKDRALVILDDAGQYDDQGGDRWKLVSWSQRLRSFGAKRNCCIDIACEQKTDAIAIWDDDDLYMPWALAAIDNALEQGAWARPTIVIDNSKEWGDRGPLLAQTASLSRSRHAISYHGAWAYRVEAYRDAGGYPECYAGDCDTSLGAMIRRNVGASIDPICGKFPRPYYVYCYGRPCARFNDVGRWNRMPEASAEDVALFGVPEYVGYINTKLPDDYWQTVNRNPWLLPYVRWDDRPKWKAAR